MFMNIRDIYMHYACSNQAKVDSFFHSRKTKAHILDA